MHIYYYEKNGFYYVMNENGVLEKYSVTNNIEMILKQENIIYFFKRELNKECNQFRFKPIQELNILEKSNLGQLITLISVLEYSIFKENTFPLLVIEASLINVINETYKNRKQKLQNGDILLEELLTELLVNLNSKLDFIKQISHYQKEIVPLSEFDYHALKIYIDTEKEIEDYRDNIDIELDLNWNPENIFKNNQYEKLVEMECNDEQELDFQWKIKTIKEFFLKKYPKEVETKLNISLFENFAQKFFLCTNASISLAMIGEIVKQYLNSPEKELFDSFNAASLIFSFFCYFNYRITKSELNKVTDPVLKLEKKDK